MKVNRFAIDILSLVLLNACSPESGEYVIYTSSESENIAYVINARDGEFFIGENAWKFSIKADDFDRKIYPQYKVRTISMPQINIAIKESRSNRRWKIQNIECFVEEEDPKGYLANCKSGNMNETRFYYQYDSGIIEFTANCMNSELMCRYKLHSGNAINYETIKKWELEYID